MRVLIPPNLVVSRIMQKGEDAVIGESQVPLQVWKRPRWCENL